MVWLFHRNASSRLATYASYLSTFQNLHVYHTSGNFGMTRAADLLSRSEIWSVVDPTGISQDKLEILAQDTARKLPKKLIIKPELLHKLMTSTLDPTFLSSVPQRKIQPYSTMPYHNLEELWSSTTQEQEILDLITGGTNNRYSRIKPNTKVFASPKRGKIMSKQDFEKLEKRFKFDEIHEHLQHLKTHLSPDQGTHPVQNFPNQNCHGEINNLIVDEEGHSQDRELLETFPDVVKKFVEAVKDHIETYDLMEQEPTLYRMAQVCTVNLTNITLSDLIYQYQRSSLYNTGGEFNFELMSFVHIHKRNERVVFKTGPEGELMLHLDYPLRLPAHEAQIIEVDFTIKSDQVATMKVNNDMIQLHVESQQRGAVGEFFYIGLYNSSDLMIEIPTGRPVATLQFLSSSCHCLTERRLYIIEKHTGKRAASIPPVLLINTMTATLLDLDLAPFVDESVELNGITATALPVAKKTETEVKPMDKRSYNLVVALQELMSNQQIFSSELVRELQDTCEHLSQKRRLVESGQTSSFTIRDKLLFKYFEEKPSMQKVETLCLPQETFKYLVKALHARGYHFSSVILMNHLQRYFYCQDMKKVVDEATRHCMACFLCQSSYKNTYIHNLPEAEPDRIFQTLYCDMCESLPRDKHGYAYLAVLVDRATNYCMPIPLKGLSSKELATQLDYLFGLFLAPQRMITDFGSCFRGEFLILCRKWNISLEKTLPRRPQANSSECFIRLYRSFLEKYLVNCGGAKARANWSRHVSFCAAIFNSCVTLQSRGGLDSPADLFFGPHRYNSTRLVTLATDPELEAYRQSAGLQKIFDIRNRDRERYKGTDIARLFKPGMIVARVLSKGELTSIDHGVSIPPGGRVKALYVILSVTKTSARCRALNTTNANNTQTFHFGEIKPVRMDSKEIHGLLLNPRTESNFSAGIFRHRGGNSLFAKIADAKKFQEELVEDGLQDDEDSIERDAAIVQRSIMKEHGIDPNTAGLVMEESDDEAEADPASLLETGDPDDLEQTNNPVAVPLGPDGAPLRRSERRRERALRAASQPPPPPEVPAPTVRKAASGPRKRGRPRKVHHFQGEPPEKRVRFVPVLEERRFDILEAASDYGDTVKKQIRDCHNNHNRKRYLQALSFFPNLNRPSVTQFMYHVKVLDKVRARKKRNKAC